MKTVQLGYEPKHAMSIMIAIRECAHTTWDDRTHFFAQLREKVTQFPGVVGTRISTNVSPSNGGFTVEALAKRPPSRRRRALSSSARNTSQRCRFPHADRLAPE